MKFKKQARTGNSLAVQWLELRTSTAGGNRFDPWWGTKISKAQLGQKGRKGGREGRKEGRNKEEKKKLFKL